MSMANLSPTSVGLLQEIGRYSSGITGESICEDCVLLLMNVIL
jgi:hypothetical protein